MRSSASPALALAAVLLAASACPAWADFRVEAETYSYADGEGIYWAECNGALNGIAVYGVNRNGECLDYNFDCPEPLCARVSVYAAWTTNEQIDFSVEFWEMGETFVASDTLRSGPGSGVG